MIGWVKSLRFIFMPGHWNRIRPYSAAWDQHVRRSIASGDVRDVTQYTARVGGVTTWIANYPYGYGSPHGIGPDVMPSRQTVVDLSEAVIAALVRQGGRA